LWLGWREGKQAREPWRDNSFEGNGCSQWKSLVWGGKLRMTMGIDLYVADHIKKSLVGDILSLGAINSSLKSLSTQID
jgi:hypothetical protein